MKIKKTALLLGIALASSVLTHSVQAQVLSVSPGDLLVGFYSVDGTSVGQNTYVYNLGQASTWRENTSATSLIGNINADLENAFGAGWYDNGNIRWGILGSVAIDEAAINGDPSLTNYFSRGLDTFAPGSSTAPSFVAAQRGTLANNSKTFRNAMNGKASGANNKGAIVATTSVNDYSDFLPPTTSTFFGVGTNPNSSFGAGTIGTGTGGYGVEGALDLWRVLNTTTGADLTAGLSGSPASVGLGQYIGTFTLDSAGNLRLDAVPEPSTYALIALGAIAVIVMGLRKRLNA